MSLQDKLKNVGSPDYLEKRPPLWDGPDDNGPRGGVTYSLLSRYLCCKERFRIHVIEGIRPAPSFNHRIEYGHMWHVCEEAYAKGWQNEANEQVLTEYARDLCRRYPTQQDQIDHWYQVCRVQFPLYVKYWSRHPDVKNRTPLFQEQVFNVIYSLPSGRYVRLRGKWDSVDLIGSGELAGVYLQENKTKGDIREEQLKRQLTFDLQSMLYLVALKEEQERLDDSSIKAKLSYRRQGRERHYYSILGILYNVVRRPLSGGKGSITRHKATAHKPEESRSHFYGRVASYIRDEPQSYFMRWRVDVTPDDIETFRKTCLDPILENLLDDYEWWAYCATCPLPVSPALASAARAAPALASAAGAAPGVYDYSHRATMFPAHRLRHYRHPFGVYNVLDEGGASDLDEFLSSGSMLGLTRVDKLFEELGG